MTTWRRGQGLQFTPHFHARELECGCMICSQQQIDDRLLEKLEQVRIELGVPLKITSAYRCSRYQQMLRARGYETAKGVSSHELGQAADVTTGGDSAPLLAIVEKHFPNIGVATTWLHVDLRPGGPRRWSYKA